MIEQRRDGSAGSKPRVLVVEDEWMIAEDFGDILGQAGFEILGPANTAKEAERLMTEPFAVALLDVNLGHGSSFVLADKLDERGIPYAFITGYARDDLPERVTSHMLISKPVTDEELPNLVRRLLAGEGAAAS